MEIQQDTTWDVVISGAGPAGLTAGILCAQAGMRVMICEAGTRPAPFPRGETVHDDPLLSQLLGPGFMEKIAVHKTGLRRFLIPGAKKIVEVTRKKESYIFEWDQFIKGLWDKAVETGVHLEFGKKVISPVIEQDRCVGVRVASGDVIRGKTVLACDGSSSLLGQAVGLDYQAMNCPITKTLLSSYRDTYPGLLFYFITRGELEFAPRFPPAVAFFFPRGNGKCEAGMMVLTSAALSLSGQCDLPDDKEMLRVWRKVQTTHPQISRLMEGTRKDFESATSIPSAKKPGKAMTVPGLILIGDALGFVEASGASGLLSSMKGAQFVADYLDQHRTATWSRDSMQDFNQAFDSSDISKKIRTVYSVVIPFINFVFARLQTSKRINRNWWLIRWFYLMG